MVHFQIRTLNNFKIYLKMVKTRLATSISVTNAPQKVNPRKSLLLNLVGFFYSLKLNILFFHNFRTTRLGPKRRRKNCGRRSWKWKTLVSPIAPFTRFEIFVLLKNTVFTCLFSNSRPKTITVHSMWVWNTAIHYFTRRAESRWKGARYFNCISSCFCYSLALN